jgi:hypothetical protein
MLCKKVTGPMIEKIADFYSQRLRIDLAPASILADLSPQNETYCFAAERGGFVVCVAQGEPQESVYISLAEQIFDHLSEAQELVEILRSAHPTAAFFDFVTYPAGGEPLTKAP